MPHREYMTKLKLDEREIASRRAFYELTDEDLARLAALRPFAEKCTAGVVDDVYALLLEHPETRKFLSDDALVRRLKNLQTEYFLGLFTGHCDLEYVEDRLRVGAAHQRIGLEPKWYIGAFARYLRQMHVRLTAQITDGAELSKNFRSLQKLVYFDMSLALDTYIEATAQTIVRHQAAIRELSTPVIRVHDRVLLLPVVGTIDSYRAQQIMETVLLRVTEDQARVVIVDIAGVPVIDTKVADHLLKTTAAVRLLGAKTILTGISAQIARTIVQLGVDISAMDTRSRLADGIELALDMVGKAIGPKVAP